MNLEANQRILDVQERVELVCAAEYSMTTCVRPAERAFYLPTADTTTRRTTFAWTSMIVIADMENSVNYENYLLVLKYLCHKDMSMGGLRS